MRVQASRDEDWHLERAPRAHIVGIARQLRQHLRRPQQSKVVEETLQRQRRDAHAKLHMLAIHVQWPGPPLACCLDCVANSQRSAVAAFFCGEFALARYAANYFARSLLPRPEQGVGVGLLGEGDARRVCLACWHEHETAYYEDEAHVVHD